MTWRRFLISLFVALLFVLLRAEPAAAQSIMLTCVGGHVDGLGINTDGDVNPRLDEDWTQDIRNLLKVVHECGLEYAVSDIVPLVRPWYYGLLVIMVVWTGVTVMLGGSIDFARIIGHIMLVLFSYGLFESYYSPTPVLNLFGVNRGLAHTIADGARVISDRIFDTGGDAYLVAFEAAELQLKAEAAEIGADYSLLRTVVTGLVLGPVGLLIKYIVDKYGSFTGALWAFSVTSLMWLLLLVYHVIYWIIMSQYLWGYFGLTVVSMFGPIFIPLVLVPQLEDYFWGWLKALIQFSFYMITGAAMFVVVSSILTVPLLRLAEVQVPTNPDAGLAGLLEFGGMLWTQYFPIIVTAFLASLQISGLTNGLTSGAQMPAGGLLSRFTQLGAGIAAAGRSVDYARDKVAGYMGGRAPLSAETGRQRQAILSAKEASQQGVGGSGGGSPSGGLPASQRATRQAFNRLRRAKTDDERRRLLDVWSRRIEAAYARQ